jgi:hypothetical protein
MRTLMARKMVKTLRKRCRQERNQVMKRRHQLSHHKFSTTILQNVEDVNAAEARELLPQVQELNNNQSLL